MSDDSATTDSTVAEAAGTIADAGHVVALTGAGVSTASGIPDFRSDGGIWDEFDPNDFRYSRFRADPEGFWRERVDLHEMVYGDDPEPNPAHQALSELESAGVLDAVITQNIDGLHAAAGTESVIELHGNAERVVCDDCGRRFDAAPARERVENGDVPPRCGSCEGLLKPDVVLFGEQLPQGALQQGQDHARDADAFMAVGSSLTVEPAASLPRVAARNGATLVVVNLDETPVSGRAEYDFRQDVTDVLPAIADAIRDCKT